MQDRSDGKVVVTGASSGLGKGAAIRRDATDREQVKALVDGAVVRHGRIAVRLPSEGLRKEMTRHDVRTTVISPGRVAAGLPFSAQDPEAAARVRRPCDKAAVPADFFARALLYVIEQAGDDDIDEILFQPTARDL